MLRFTRIRAVSVPKDLNDWSRLGNTMKDMTVGKCFDRSVLEKSVVPTLHLQRSLFRLPIPKFEDTCKRYHDSVKPLLPPADMAKTEKNIDEFVKGTGASLHEELVQRDKANQGTSYISADWFDLYLKDRTPLPINYNPSLITRSDPDKRDGLTRAAFWIASSVRWRKLYLKRTLKPEVFYFCKPEHYCRRDWFQRTVALTPERFSAKVMAIGSQFMAFPLDMSQYDSLFATTRIPRPVVDELVTEESSCHIVVNYRGHQFKVTVADENFDPLPEAQIYARLKQIVDTNAKEASTDVGIYTAMNRSEWNGLRMDLLRMPKNKVSLQAVDSALFAVNLDFDREAELLTSSGSTKTSRDFLVSDSNRWWDKSVSITVLKDGTLGVMFEHSWGDGVAVLRYTVDMFNETVSRPSSSMDRKTPATEPLQQLEWDLTDANVNAGRVAKDSLQREMGRMDYYVGVMDAFGKSDKIFKGKVKADPFMQVAMQLAWWRLNKSTVSTYESASTAAFLKGRTECIRSATIESQRFTVIFDSPTATVEEKVKALMAATSKHGAISKDAKMGNGIDRHLFALKKLAERRGGDMPGLFNDPAYTTFGSNILSTSSLFSEALIGGGFGPVSPGYGVGYASADNVMLFNISCWKAGGPNHSAEEFFKAVYVACVDMYNMLASVKQ